MFQSEIDTMNVTQKEEIMQVTTSWEEKGMAKGMEKGMEQATRSIAINLIHQGISLATIAQATGLTIAQLQQLQAEST
jgi:predicted transposase/invertase (TIGR01784 family)